MKVLPLFLVLCMFVGQEIASAETPPLTSEQVVKKVQEVYSHHCCFRAKFDQLTVNTAMDLRDRFRGMMYVKKPGSISLDVESRNCRKWW